MTRGKWVDHICFSSEHSTRKTVLKNGLNKAKKYQYSKQVIKMIRLGEQCGVIVIFADGSLQAIKMVEHEWIKE